MKLTKLFIAATLIAASSTAFANANCAHASSKGRNVNAQKAQERAQVVAANLVKPKANATVKGL